MRINSLAYNTYMSSSIPVVVVPYDPAWPLLFEEEKANLLADIGQYVISLEHMGSTAVPGLAAKPVIDILIGVRSLEDAPLFIPPLVYRGYEYIPQYETTFPERRYLHRIVEGQHTHHLHIVEPTSEFYRTQLSFRDYLRAHPNVCKEYATLKFRLAKKFHNDREAYTDAKADFIQGVLAKCV